MILVLSGQVSGAGQRAEVCAPGGRQADGVKCGNRAWVRRKAIDIGWTARNGVEDIRIDLGRAFTTARKRAGSWWVAVGLQLKPTCGPKLSFCAFHAPIPVRIVMPVKRLDPLPKVSTPMWLSLSVRGPKQEKR